MRKLAALMLSLSLSASILAGCGSSTGTAQPATKTGPAPTETPAAKVFQIGVTQIVEHPSLDTVRKGVIDGLKEAGFEDGKQVKIEFQSAQGEMPNAQAIAQKFAADKKDLIVAITTPSAMAAAQATKTIPIIFGTVTDPVAAQLVTSLEKPGGNVTGTSDMAPVKEQLALFAQLGAANVKKVGIIYNPGEANSVVLAKATQDAAKALGLTIVEATVTGANEVQQAAQSLVGRVDGLYLFTDNTLAQGIQSVIKIAADKKLPTISAERSYVDQGVTATLGLDYYLLGKQTGGLAADVLKGKQPADLPVQTSKELKLIINTKTAKAIGLSIPKDQLDKAEQVEK